MPKRGRRNKGGRPRVEGERYENGQLTKAAKAERRKEAERADKAAESENIAVVVAQRVKHIGISEEMAKMQSAPVTAFRWWKNGTIHEHHYRAAEAFLQLYNDYLRAIRCPGLPRVSGGAVDTDINGTDPEYVDWCKRKRAEWDAVRNALLRSGPFAMMAAKMVAVENTETHKLEGEFRAAMNIVHRLLIAAERN